jgi:hypothetical protein
MLYSARGWCSASIFPVTATVDHTPKVASLSFAKRRAHRTLAEGSSFKLERINLDRWDDLEAAAHFEWAVDRRARRIVQENSLGLLAPWRSHLVAQVMLQFPTFVICARSKQFLHNVHTCGTGRASRRSSRPPSRALLGT